MIGPGRGWHWIKLGGALIKALPNQLRHATSEEIVSADIPAPELLTSRARARRAAQGVSGVEDLTKKDFRPEAEQQDVSARVRALRGVHPGHETIPEEDGHPLPAERTGAPVPSSVSSSGTPIQVEDGEDEGSRTVKRGSEETSEVVHKRLRSKMPAGLRVREAVEKIKGASSSSSLDAAWGLEQAMGTAGDDDLRKRRDR